MLKYILKILQHLNHKAKVILQYSLHKYAPIIYGQKGVQQMVQNNDKNYLLKKDIKYIQSIARSFLCHTRAFDSTMLAALNEIGTT